MTDNLMRQKVCCCVADDGLLVQLSQRNISEFELLANDFGIKKENCNKTVEYLNNNVLCLARAALKGLNAGIFQVPVSTRTATRPR